MVLDTDMKENFREFFFSKFIFELFKIFRIFNLEILKNWENDSENNRDSCRSSQVGEICEIPAHDMKKKVIFLSSQGWPDTVPNQNKREYDYWRGDLSKSEIFSRIDFPVFRIPN